MVEYMLLDLLTEGWTIVNRLQFGSYLVTATGNASVEQYLEAHKLPNKASSRERLLIATDAPDDFWSTEKAVADLALQRIPVFYSPAPFPATENIGQVLSPLGIRTVRPLFSVSA